MPKKLFMFILVSLNVVATQQYGAYRPVTLPTQPMTVVGSDYESDGTIRSNRIQAVRSDGSYAEEYSISTGPVPRNRTLYFIDNRTGYELTIDIHTKVFLRKPISRQAAAGALWAPNDCEDALKNRSPMSGVEFKADKCTPGEPDGRYFTIPEGFREVLTYSDFNRTVREAHGMEPEPPGRWAKQDAAVVNRKAAGPFYDESVLHRATQPSPVK